MQHVTLLCLPQSLGSSTSLPLEMLNAADALNRSRNRRQTKLVIQVASISMEPIKTAGGLTILPDCNISDISHTDLLILPALWRDPQQSLRRFPEVLPWLQQLAVLDCLICAVGTSSCWLAAAGLLDNKPATTHWYYCDEFKKHYPKVDLKPQYLITQANNLYCAGSVNSVADLMVHLINRTYGQAIARQVEGQFSPEIRQPYENHAYAQHATGIHQDETIIQAQEWLRQYADQEVSLRKLADQLRLSMRSFNRRFKQAAGITASQYLQQCRINNAKELLRTSNISIAEIAERSGYQDSSYFCARFKQQMGQTPLTYRSSVRGKLFKLDND